MTRTAALRLSLFVSLGLIPIACSGKMLSGGGGDDDDDGGGVGNAGGSGGTRAGATAGKPSKGGAPPTGTGGGGGSLGGTNGEGGRRAGGCTNGKLDPTTGLVSCEEGYLARPTAKQCAVPELGAGGAGGEPTLPRADRDESCDVDSDCAHFQLGYCRVDDEGFGGESSFCDSGCANDADCGPGQICLCSAGSTHGGACRASDCKTNAECNPGFVCASYSVPCGLAGLACTTEQDTCPSSECSRDVCTFDRELGHRICNDVVCGRPFLVEQQGRVAPVILDAAWSLRAAPRVEHLSAQEREDLAAHWTKLGQMEHASIAAFARFQLQLLALGAPPELVQACNQALIDETHHTQLCFGLASAYAGHDVGPGPLDVSRSLDVTSLADVVDLVIAEGCFGETSAALEALAAADEATDPVLRHAYARIAEDEQRHAELAFRFVRWALERDHASVATRIVAALRNAPAPVRDVAVPCLQALLGAASSFSNRSPTLLPGAAVAVEADGRASR